MNASKFVPAFALLAVNLLPTAMTASHSSTTLSTNNAATVGVSTIAVKDSARGRNLTTEIWFQADSSAKAEGFSAILPIASIPLAQNSEPASDFKKRPLVVISHGNWGTRYSQGWLASRLVKAGYVVVSPSHPGTMNDDRTATGAFRLWDRSEDVRFALSAVLKDPKWTSLIDQDRIVFWGHSFGGWTGVSLAGGKFDVNQEITACKEQTPRDMYCNGLLAEDISKISLAGSDGSYVDNRFKAFYLTATGPVRGMTVPSLKAISAPMLFDTAQFDEVLAPEMNSTWAAKIVPTATEIVRPVGHFVYVPLCKPIIGKLAASLICTDLKGVERADIHEKVGTDVVRFFDKSLDIKRQ
jgi:predicted dienelactone hydrolase